MNVSRIGIDFGGVIVDRSTHPLHSADLLSAVPMVDAFASIAELVREFGTRGVHIISRAGSLQDQWNIRFWLNHNRFFEKTGMLAENICFCRSRHQKTAICLELGIDVFIDDRIEVLSLMIDAVEYLFAFRAIDASSFSSWVDDPRIRHVQTWREIVDALRT